MKNEDLASAVDWIVFDADDTLWHNEPIFQATEVHFAELLSAHQPSTVIREKLFSTEMKNLKHFGYGIKGFTLSMIETALELTEGKAKGSEIRQILDWGREMLAHPVQLLDGVRETVEILARDHQLMLLTKGDLFDQESKLARSGIGDAFAAVEIVSEKDAATYRRIMKRHAIRPERFLMVGNSLRSDVLPAIEAGAVALHIPYAVTWAHEQLEVPEGDGALFSRLERIADLVDWITARNRREP